MMDCYPGRGRPSLENPLSASIEEQVARPPRRPVAVLVLTATYETDKWEGGEERTLSLRSPSIMEANSAFPSEFEWRRLPLSASVYWTYFCYLFTNVRVDAGLDLGAISPPHWNCSLSYFEGQQDMGT